MSTPGPDTSPEPEDLPAPAVAAPGPAAPAVAALGPAAPVLSAPGPEPALGSLPYLVYATMLKNALDAGGHNDIHHLINAMQWRTWGTKAAGFLQLAWGAKMDERARALFSHSHFVDFAEADNYIRNGPPNTEEAVPIPPRRPAVAEIIRDDCVDCFRFLVNRAIISVNGFDHYGESYLASTLTYVGDSQVAKYCLLYMPGEDLLNPIRIPWIPEDNPSREEYFPYLGHEFEGPCQVWINRVYEVFSGDDPIVEWPARGLTAPANGMPLFPTWSLPVMIPWIDDTSAQKLYEMGVNINRGHIEVSYTSWGALYYPGKAQGRHALMRWMANHVDGIPMHNRLTWIDPGTDLVPAGFWPPWALAVAAGDRLGAGIISKIPDIGPLEIGYIFDPNEPVGWNSPPPRQTRLIGWATMHFNVKGLAMLRRWLKLAWSELTRQQGHAEIIAVLERILYRISVECVAIRELKRQPVPAGSTPTKAERNRQLREIQAQKVDISRRMVRMIVDDSIKEARTDASVWPGVPDNYPYRTLGDLPEYKKWARDVQGKRKGEFPLIKSVLDQLDCPAGLNRRELRSGHDPMDTS